MIDTKKYIEDLIDKGKKNKRIKLMSYSNGKLKFDMNEQANVSIIGNAYEALTGTEIEEEVLVK